MNIPNITATNFKAEVLDSPVPVIVDYYGDFCSPCRAMAPVLAELAAEVSGRAKIVKLDVVAEEELAQEFNIDLIPTIIVFKNGEPTERMVGTKTKRELLAALDL
jgi:thioredoxin 1